MEHQKTMLRRVGAIEFPGGQDARRAPGRYAQPKQQSTARQVYSTASREESDDYSKALMQLNSDWRVACCRDDLQWLLQKRRGQRDGQPIWRSHKYCRTRVALIRECRSAGVIDDDAAQILASLPERFGGQK